MPSTSFERLKEFLLSEMRMSHVYQPLMIRTLLERGGAATRRDIARCLLAEDQSQLEYYEEITQRMPGRVLANRGVVTRQRQTYTLASGLNEVTEAERAELIAICNQELRKYIERRGEAIWDYRRLAPGDVPGTVRFDVLTTAGGRCGDDGREARRFDRAKRG